MIQQRVLDEYERVMADDYVETDVQLIHLLWQTLLNNTNLKPKEPEPEPEPDEEEKDK